MTVECETCGREWRRDPVLEVACPQCGADVGVKCRRPSGHPCSVHASRDKKALREVDDYERCPGTPDDDHVDETLETDDRAGTTQTRLSAVTDGGEA